MAAADTAVTEAVAATEASIELQDAPPVQRPFVPSAKGFTAQYEYSARITDEKKALKWLLDKGEWSFLKGAALTKLIQSACDKTAKLKLDEFVMDGAKKVKTPKRG